jgi:hypothetical protein
VKPDENADGGLAPLDLSGLPSLKSRLIGVAQHFEAAVFTKTPGFGLVVRHGCVALNIPRAIRLIRLFNIVFFSLFPVDTRCVERRNGAIALFFHDENKKARPRFLAAGLFIIFDRGGRPQALGRIVAAPSTMCQFHESSKNR